MSEKELIRTKPLVERVLQEDALSRDDDMRLIISVWHLQGLRLTHEQIELLKNTVSSPESIRRTRQKFQESGKYLGSAPVATQRTLFEEQHRGYHRNNRAY